MIDLSVRGLVKGFEQGNDILKGITFDVNAGERVGILGRNGCGKTTFFRILSGELQPDAGTVSIASGRRLGLISQIPVYPDGWTTEDVLREAHRRLYDMEARMNELTARMATDDSPALLAEYDRLSENFRRLGGYDMEHERNRVANGLDIPAAMRAQPFDSLSGGEKTRVNLARLILEDTDILLLDEPTNNLDIDTIRWLEQVLNERDSTMIIISHDRHFLNMVCTHMADLDYGELRVYPGNYDEYMTAATQARERLLADNAKKKAQIAELQSFVSRFSANASKSRQATSRARQIDKIKLEEVKASSRQNPFIRFEQDKKLFRNALEVEGLTKGFDNGPLFKNLNLLLEVGEKLAVLGTNGVGKSTLLKTLVGDLQPDSGTVKWSENARIGYYAQDHEYEFENDLTVFEWMSQWKQEGDDEQAVRSILGRLLFSQDDIKKPAKVLSGGEKGRMLFGKLMMQKPNILIMDEPTNHLDMESIESLNMALELYQGTLIFVSHDREFVSSLATRILEITPERVIDFSGNYEDYLRSKGIE